MNVWKDEQWLEAAIEHQAKHKSLAVGLLIHSFPYILFPPELHLTSLTLFHAYSPLQVSNNNLQLHSVSSWPAVYTSTVTLDAMPTAQPLWALSESSCSTLSRGHTLCWLYYKEAIQQRNMKWEAWTCCDLREGDKSSACRACLRHLGPAHPRVHAYLCLLTPISPTTITTPPVSKVQHTYQ